MASDEMQHSSGAGGPWRGAAAAEGLDEPGEPLPGATQGARRSELAPRVRHVMAIAGSRGGVGCSLLSVNFAVYLAQLGRKVALVDANPAGAFLHALLGVAGGRVLQPVEDEDKLSPIGTQVPGLLLEPQRYLVGFTHPARPGRKPRWARELRKLDVDYVVVDLGAGTATSTLDLFLQADSGVVVAAPDPPSVEGAYRLLRALFHRRLRRALVRDRHNLRVVQRVAAGLPALPSPLSVIQGLASYETRLGELATRELGGLRARLVINGARLRAHGDLGPAMADLARRYLGVTTEYVGSVEQDDAVWLSVSRQRPLLIDSPTTKAARNLERIARRLLALTGAREAEASATPAPPATIEPTLYDILTTHPAAGDDELRKASRRQREIFHPDSLPLSSLLTDDQLATERARIEEAHDTLLDPVKRRAYDLSTFPDRREKSKAPSPDEDPAVRAERELLREQLADELTAETRFTGALLRKVREARGIPLDEIARRTKISFGQLEAIEQEQYQSLPPFVYLRGFVQEVAKVLELDPTQVSRTYLRRYAEWRAERPQESR